MVLPTSIENWNQCISTGLSDQFFFLSIFCSLDLMFPHYFKRDIKRLKHCEQVDRYLWKILNKCYVGTRYCRNVNVTTNGTRQKLSTHSIPPAVLREEHKETKKSRKRTTISTLSRVNNWYWFRRNLVILSSKRDLVPYSTLFEKKKYKFSMLDLLQAGILYIKIWKYEIKNSPIALIIFTPLLFCFLTMMMMIFFL